MRFYERFIYIFRRTDNEVIIYNGIFLSQKEERSQTLLIKKMAFCKTDLAAYLEYFSA